MRLSKEYFGLAVAVVVFALFFYRQRTRPPAPPVVVKHAEAIHELKQVSKDQQHASAKTDQTTVSPPALTTPEPPANREPPPPEKPNINTAPEIAWENANVFSQEPLPSIGLSPPHAPPAAGEATLFRGYILKNSQQEDQYIELRFEHGKWIISEGPVPEQMTSRPPRDVIPYKDHTDQWVLYYDDSESVFLQHFASIAIPDLNGDYEILSGWFLKKDQLWFLALINTTDGWPTKTLIHQLAPRRREH